MTDKYIKTLIYKIEKGTSSQIFNSLVEIRTKVLKSRNGLTRLLQHGGIPPILQLLKQLDDVDSPDKKRQKTTDIVLSILGNMCMDEGARSDVQKNGGIYVFARYFMESALEGVQNRSCRSLANLALSPNNCHLIHRTEILPQLVENLEKTENKECQQTYCRAIRLLGRTSEQREKLVSLGSILPVAKLVSSEDPDVISPALRTLTDISSSGCSFDFASQFLSAGAVKTLVSFVVENKEQFREQAFSLLFHLNSHSNIRPAFGAAEGIQCFISLINSGTEEKHMFSMINVICMCCRESVNRVKLRENGALEIFLNALIDDKFKQIHSRIISGLQCFIYDEVSMNLLLEKDIIPILIKHLQRVTDYTSVPWKLEDIHLSSREGMDLEDKQEIDETIFRKFYQLQPLNQLCKEENNDVVSSLRETSSDTSYVKKNFEEDPEKNYIGKDHVFSIDSPTYEPKSDWNSMDYYSGVKCKQNFNPPEACIGQSPESSLSPLSTISFYSPNLSPNSFSMSSPENPKEYSTVNRDPEYPLVFSTSYTCGSPGKGWSPDLNTSGVNEEDSPEEYVYSEPEDIDVENSDHNIGKVNSARYLSIDPAEDTNSDDKKDKTIDLPNNMNMFSKTDTCSNSNKRQRDETSELVSQLSTTNLQHTSQKYELQIENFEGQESSVTPKSSKAQPSKRRKIEIEDTASETDVCNQKLTYKSKSIRKKRNSSCATENQILMILSRISQMYDPSKYMVTMETMCALLDYLAIVDQPEMRAARLLSRIIRNPLCFENLMQIHMPLLVYYKLLHDADGGNLHGDIKTLLKCRDKFLKNKKSEMRHRLNSSTSSEVSFLDIEDTPMSDTESLNKARVHMENENQESPDCLKCDESKETTSTERTESIETSLVVKSGLTLLQDLCTQADSPFGRGVIMHWYARKDQETKIMTTICLVNIAWTRGMLQYYFLKKGILQDILQILAQQTEVSSVHNALLLEGMSFLGHVLEQYQDDEKIDLSSQYCVLNPSSVSKTDDHLKSKCRMLDVGELDVSFIVADGKVKGNRDTLVKSSSLFAAMLEGYYSESNLSEIPLGHTTRYATQYILHHLHGCDTHCDTISDLLTCDINNENVCNCLDALSLAHKYMLDDLQKFLTNVVSFRLMTLDNACHVFQYSLIYDFVDLAVECVKHFFRINDTSCNKVKAFQQFICGPNSETFLEYLADFFKNLAC